MSRPILKLHQMRPFFVFKCTNVVGYCNSDSSPQTPLGELTAIHREINFVNLEGLNCIKCFHFYSKCTKIVDS